MGAVSSSFFVRGRSSGKTGPPGTALTPWYAGGLLCKRARKKGCRTTFCTRVPYGFIYSTIRVHTRGMGTDRAFCMVAEAGARGGPGRVRAGR